MCSRTTKGKGELAKKVVYRRSIEIAKVLFQNLKEFFPRDFSFC